MKHEGANNEQEKYANSVINLTKKLIRRNFIQLYGLRSSNPSAQIAKSEYELSTIQIKKNHLSRNLI